MLYPLFCLFLLLLPSLAAIQQELPKAEISSLKDPKEIINLQLKNLDHLSEMTKMTLSQITHLRAMIAKYQKIQELYLQQPKDKELLYHMTKLASDLLKEIKNSHLGHAFDPEFLSELRMLAKIYKKNELPKL